ncbi:MAG: glycosyltransferase family 4 protein [Haliea sp.]|nr:glycosyltransferase family 4 protein [Haliea sp.]
MHSQTDTRRVLLITRNLPPLIGGMERMMQQFAEGLCQYSELTVIGPKGCKQHLPSEISVFETSPRLARFLLKSTWLALRACRKKRFDMVIGGSGLIGPTLRILAWRFRCKTLVYLHGLDLVVDNRLYQLLFVPSLRKIDSVAVNSGNTRDLAVAKGIDARRIAVVNPGASLPAPIDTGSRLEFRRRHAVHFDRYLVFTGRMTKRKGLSVFLQHILPLIIQREPGIGLVVVGGAPQDSLNQLGEQAEIQQQISAQCLHNSVTFLGNLSDRDLEICYAEATLQILPLIEVPGDVEGFGMVAIEAAASGTPTVAFELGGVADAISAGNGCLVAPGEFSMFADKVVNILRNGGPTAEHCAAHARQFTWQIYNERMRALIERPRNSSTENR